SSGAPRRRVLRTRSTSSRASPTHRRRSSATRRPPASALPGEPFAVRPADSGRSGPSPSWNGFWAGRDDSIGGWPGPPTPPRWTDPPTELREDDPDAAGLRSTFRSALSASPALRRRRRWRRRWRGRCRRRSFLLGTQAVPRQEAQQTTADGTDGGAGGDVTVVVLALVADVGHTDAATDTAQRRTEQSRSDLAGGGNVLEPGAARERAKEHSSCRQSPPSSHCRISPLSPQGSGGESHAVDEVARARWQACCVPDRAASIYKT